MIQLSGERPAPRQRLRRTVLVVVLCLVVLIARAWGADAAKVRVFVSVIPQAYFVERVGGDKVDVEVLVGPGQSPHTYEPTPKQVARLGEARLFFRVGIPLENTLVPKISRSFPNIEIVDTRKGIALIALDHHHGQEPENHHEHGRDKAAPDPHIWLDPQRVKIQARTICDALIRADPARTILYRDNLAVFIADLDKLHSELVTIFAPVKGSKIYTFHPAFGYVADAYGFTQVSVEIGGKEPSARQLANVTSRARAEGVRILFVQPQFSKKIALAVAREIGGAVVPIDPLPRDYLSEMKGMARTIRNSRPNR